MSVPVHGQRTADGFWLEPSAAFLESTTGQAFLLAVAAWEAEEFAAQVDGKILLKDQLWKHLYEERTETVIQQREIFDEVVPTTSSTWSVQCASFVGAPRLEVALTRNGEPAHSAGPLPSPEAFVLLELATDWNAQPAHSVAAQLEFIATLKALREACARRGEQLFLDEHLGGFDVRRVSKVKLAWEPSSRREGLFDLQATIPDGPGETRLPLDDLDSERPVAFALGKKATIFDEETASALRHVRARHRSRSRKDVDRVLHDPAAVLPGGVAPESIDLSEYSHRVTRFERVVRAARPEDIKSSGVRWFDDEPANSDAFLELEVTSGPTSPSAKLVFDTPEEAQKAADQLDHELQRSTPAPLAIGQSTVVPTRPLHDRLSLELAIHRRLTPPEERSEPIRPVPRLVAVIDEDAVFDSEEGRRLLDDVPWDRLSRSLRPEIQLKEHQRAGVAWLAYHQRKGCPGVLLADEMGLGKTLQVACHLALARQQEGEKRPSLVVAPVALLENWLNEIDRFFRPGTFGDVFVLHREGLRRVRSGAGLDVEALRGMGLVVTNYETLARYQLELLKIDWDVVVLDESHNIKNADALKSRACCGLKRRFAIAMTGTPVENHLLDLWAHFFFLSPHSPFGDRKQFTALAAGGAEYAREALDYPSTTSRVLRRTKAVLDLPPKLVQVHEIAMTPEQVELERSITRRAESPLKALELLRKLYAHPLLLRAGAEDESSWSLERAIHLSPKFARCLDLLSEIKNRGEKALVFSLSLRMQALLVQAIRERFGLKRVGVINGDSNQRGDTMALLDNFSRSEGFDSLVLSPIAAGVGLNIVAANHVIHYDRWWNPAKEDQATDRAYRIGQTRAVQVHYLLLHHPDKPDAGFDKRLHELVDRKRQLASDFLAPVDAMEFGPVDLIELLEGEAA